MQPSALVIFVRNPELGKVKTRLAKTIGNVKTLLIYEELLRHTLQVTQNLPLDKYVCYQDTINTGDLWDNSVYNKHMQKGKDLGERMLNAFALLFKKGYEKVVIIGSDCHDLNQKGISDSFHRLESGKVVIGPATDGGYYLLGLRDLIPEIFNNISWSTENVFIQTIQKLKELNIDYSVLPELSDIDEEADLTEELKIRIGLNKIDHI
ncbi:MAG: TIGR04282 family arsenosugar biosynthesis glycosyltransferase [Puia sp.]